MAKKGTHQHKVIDYTDEPDFVIDNTNLKTYKTAYADFVYKNNNDGTYYVLKNRYGEQDCDITTKELIAVLVYMVNNPK